MTIPHCKIHNVSWTCGKGCPDCLLLAMTNKYVALVTEVAHWKMIAENGGVRGSGDAIRLERDRFKLALEEIAAFNSHSKSCLNDRQLGHAIVIAEKALSNQPIE